MKKSRRKVAATNIHKPVAAGLSRDQGPISLPLDKHTLFFKYAGL